MKNINLVSIIITARNEEENISILLDVLLKQTYSFYEIVINDNGSADNTVKIIKEYRKKNSKIKLIQSHGKSIGEGRNSAIKNSKGDILALMDVGIMPEKKWLERVVEPLIKDPSLDIAWGNIIFDTKSRVVPSTIIGKALVFLTKYPENRRKGKNIPSSGIRRRVWEDFGKFPEIQLPIEDLLLISKLTEKNFRFTHVEDAKAYYFRYPSNFSQVFKKWSVSALSVFITKTSELGFYRQFIIFGLFFLTLFLLLLDIRFIVLFILYILLFLFSKAYANPELAKEVFKDPKLFFTVFYLFFLLNSARLTGVIKAIFYIFSGRMKRLKILDY